MSKVRQELYLSVKYEKPRQDVGVFLLMKNDDEIAENIVIFSFSS